MVSDSYQTKKWKLQQQNHLRLKAKRKLSKLNKDDTTEKENVKKGIEQTEVHSSLVEECKEQKEECKEQKEQKEEYKEEIEKEEEPKNNNKSTKTSKKVKDETGSDSPVAPVTGKKTRKNKKKDEE